MSDEERARYVNPYRPRAACSCPDYPADGPVDNDCPRHGDAAPLAGTGIEGTTSAPPWVPAIVDGLATLISEPYAWALPITSALAWCKAGEPFYRAEMLLTLARALPRPVVADAVVAWLEEMRKARKGRGKDATVPRHFDAVRIRRSYDDPHPPSYEQLTAERITSEHGSGRRESELQRELAEAGNTCLCETFGPDEGGGYDPRGCPVHAYEEGKADGLAAALAWLEAQEAKGGEHASIVGILAGELQEATGAGLHITHPSVAARQADAPRSHHDGSGKRVGILAAIAWLQTQAGRGDVNPGVLARELREADSRGLVLHDLGVVHISSDPGMPGEDRS